jgi:hypothetical protein
MKQKCTFLVLGLASVFVGAGAGARSPAARVLEVKGKIAIISPDKSQRTAAMFSTVYADDRLVAGSGAQATLVFRSDGHIERIGSPGTFQVTASGCEPKNNVVQVAMSQQNQAVVARISAEPGGIIQGGVVVARGGPGVLNDASTNEAEPNAHASARQIRPLPESTLLAERPTFSWPVDANAKKYVLNLYLRGKRVWSATTDAATLKYASETKLKPGAMYSWEVVADPDGDAAKICESVFHTASDRQRAEASGLEKLLSKPDTPSLALAAMWYKKNQFVTEAIAVHQRLAKRSNDTAVYWSLSELCWQAGREVEAKAAANRATELDKASDGGKGQ